MCQTKQKQAIYPGFIDPNLQNTLPVTLLLGIHELAKCTNKAQQAGL